MTSHIWPALSHWFLSNKRSLPWREEKTPYSVWVSEIMLQQTQVDVVIPYFLRWMRAFPTLKSLAMSEEEQVIKMWEGLGYYSRARNLHKGAKFVMEHFEGVFPSSAVDILRIPGIGPYTVGAIQSFAFQMRSPAVDGNVMRVMSRMFALEEDISKERTKRQIHDLLEESLPNEDSWVVTEGLIEFGALICKKDPKCSDCPLEDKCLARSMGLELKLPYKPKKTTFERLDRHVGVISSGKQFLLKKCKPGEVMAGLYEFPYVDRTEDSMKVLARNLGLDLDFREDFPRVKHSFTKYRVTLYPSFYDTQSAKQVDSMEWVEYEKLKKLPFSSGHRRILAHLADF